MTVSSFNTRVPRLLPIPNVARVCLRYRDLFVLSSTGGYAYNYFSGNSAYDPDQSVPGHQPYYYDRYSALYKQYVVLDSRIRVTCSIDTSSKPILMALYAYYQNTTTVDFQGFR